MAVGVTTLSVWHISYSQSLICFGIILLKWMKWPHAMPRRVKHSNIARWMVEMMWSLACGKSAEAFNTTGTVFCEQLEGKESNFYHSWSSIQALSTTSQQTKRLYALSADSEWGCLFPNSALAGCYSVFTKCVLECARRCSGWNQRERGVMSGADWGFLGSAGVAFVLSAPRRCALSCFPSAADSRAEPLNAAFAC